MKSEKKRKLDESLRLCDLMHEALGYDPDNPDHDQAVMYSAGFVHVRNRDVARIIDALKNIRKGG